MIVLWYARDFSDIEQYPLKAITPSTLPGRISGLSAAVTFDNQDHNRKIHRVKHEINKQSRPRRALFTSLLPTKSRFPILQTSLHSSRIS
jgi:hypothetical protein